MKMRLESKLVILLALIVLMVLPLPLLLKSIFGAGAGLTLLIVGAFVGSAAFDMSLRIAFSERERSFRDWRVIPLVTIIFLLAIPPLELWAVSVLTWGFWWFNLVLVFIFLSLLPLALGPISYVTWKRRIALEKSLKSR